MAKKIKDQVDTDQTHIIVQVGHAHLPGIKEHLQKSGINANTYQDMKAVHEKFKFSARVRAYIEDTVDEDFLNDALSNSDNDQE